MSPEPVKSAADFPERRSRPVGACVRLRGLAWGCALALLCASGSFEVARAGERESGPSLLFGGAIQPRKPPILLDPRLPRGELRGDPVGRPVYARAPLCALNRPVCVDPGWGEAGLALLVRAYEEHMYGRSLPGPRASFERPLVFAQGSGDLKLELQSQPSRGFDRGFAHCHAQAIDLATARRCVEEAAVAARSPSTASWLRAGYAASVAEEMGDAPVVEAELERARAHTQLGILTSSRSFDDWQAGRLVPVSRLRSARFFSFLDARSEAPLGHAGFIALLLCASRTVPGSSRFDSEPDLMDVMWASADSDSSALARFMDDFAQYSFTEGRASLTKRLLHWSIEGASLPRSLVLPQPLEPTGSAYVQVKLTEEQRTRILAVQTNCEAPVSYVWSVLRLDREGQRISALPIGYLERGTSVEARIEPMPGVYRLVIVGTNMGGVDMAHPFDLDHEPHESHGCRVYISVLEPQPGTAKGKTDPVKSKSGF